MTILRPLHLTAAACLIGLTSACAGRTPPPGPDPAMVRTTIEAQIARSMRAIPAQDVVVKSVSYREASRR
jgi:hypothetical protein